MRIVVLAALSIPGRGRPRRVGNMYTAERPPDGSWKVTGNQMQWIR